MPSPHTFRISGGDADIQLSCARVGPAGAPTAVVAHGAGSSADFVLRAFGPALLEAGWQLIAYDLRSHGGSTAIRDEGRLRLVDHVADLRAVAAAVDAKLLGGVSMGAHAAVLAARQAADGGERLAGLLATLPAWTGPPEVVAAANALQAAELDAIGIDAALHRITTAHPGWVADELAAAWPHHDAPAFAAVLRGLASSAAPGPTDLQALTLPAGVVALPDDPMHPAAVAQLWSQLLPRARLGYVPQPEMARDRAALGRAAVRAWQLARTEDVSASR